MSHSATGARSRTRTRGDIGPDACRDDGDPGQAQRVPVMESTGLSEHPGRRAAPEVLGKPGRGRCHSECPRPSPAAGWIPGQPGVRRQADPGATAPHPKPKPAEPEARVFGCWEGNAGYSVHHVSSQSRGNPWAAPARPQGYRPQRPPPPGTGTVSSITTSVTTPLPVQRRGASEWAEALVPHFLCRGLKVK